MFTVEIYLEVNIITRLSGGAGRHIFLSSLASYWLPVQINYHYIAITSLRKASSLAIKQISPEAFSSFVVAGSI